MTNKQYSDTIMHGHFLYWDMLGRLRRMKNHKEDKLHWLTGDINYTYFTDTIKMDYAVKRMKNGEIPKNLYFFDEPNANTAAYFLSSGLFKKDSETIGMARELCDMIIPEPNRRINLFRVREVSQLKAAGAILNASFGYKIFPFERYVEMFENNQQFFYLAEYDGLPVSAIMSQHGDSFVYISWAGTLPGYRKLGIAGSLIQMAEGDGLLQGKTMSVLHAYPKASGTYRRIGYKGYSHGIGLEYCG